MIRPLPWPRTRPVAAVLLLALVNASASAQAPEPAPAPRLVGDAQQGRALLLQRFETGCILCHQLPGLPRGGDLGPALEPVKTRWTADALRNRIADARRFNPQTIMPPYRSTEGLVAVAPAYAGRPVLTEQALEDIVAYLMLEPNPAVGPAPNRTPETQP
jgi:L-cysteine S-thiosulfotransferase